MKTHLVMMVQEEAELLRDQITELSFRNQQLQRENLFLKGTSLPPTATGDLSCLVLSDYITHQPCVADKPTGSLSGKLLKVWYSLNFLNFF
uniref:Uncharacterized protein n=1 Tax=Oryzias melastigma TaxID=30732 RepID=A0A3B3DU47_ORYME